MPWDPMPTLVEKGPLFRDLEQFLKGVGRRRRMLSVLNRIGPVNAVPGAGPPLALINAIVNTVGTGWSNEVVLLPTVPARVPGLPSARAFFEELWFTQATTVFQQTLFPLSQNDLNDAAEVVRIGLMDALEASMGITGSWRGTNAVPKYYSHRRFWPIELNWVCGKLDGFEMIIAVRRLPVSAWHLSLRGAVSAAAGHGRSPFKDGVVTVNITTPPVINSVPGFVDGMAMDVIKQNQNGILVTRFDKVTRQTETKHLKTADGGSDFL